MKKYLTAKEKWEQYCKPLTEAALCKFWQAYDIKFDVLYLHDFAPDKVWFVFTRLYGANVFVQNHKAIYILNGPFLASFYLSYQQLAVKMVFCWLGHLKMPFYCLTSHRGQGGSILLEHYSMVILKPAIFILTVKMFIFNFLPMIGFEPQTSGIGSKRSDNWATTAAQSIYIGCQFGTAKWRFMLSVSEVHKRLMLGMLNVSGQSNSRSDWAINLIHFAYHLKVKNTSSK